jgi:hypothetical protein
MHKILTSLISSFVLLASCNALAEKPAFLSLQASTQNYTVGQQAVLTAHVRILPTDPSLEIYLTSDFNGGNQKITRVSDSEAVAITNVLDAAGDFTWNVHAYLQNAVVARNTEATMDYYRAEVTRLNKALETETDAAIRTNLTAERDQDNTMIGSLNGALWDNRKFVGQASLLVHVNAASLVSTKETPLLVIDSSHENAIFNAGESATFYARCLTDFQGPDGVQEIVLNGWISGETYQNGINVTKSRIDDKEFSFQSPVFTNEDAGQRNFFASVQIRSKAQADSIRQAVALAAVRKGEMIAKMNATTDPLTRNYYQSEITELDSAINELSRQLNNLLHDVPGVKQYPFNILAN